MLSKSKLKARRRERGMNQRELAEAVGVHKDTVSKWEGAKHRRAPNGNAPSSENLLALCLVLKCTPEELMEQPDDSAKESADHREGATAKGDSDAER